MESRSLRQIQTEERSSNFNDLITFWKEQEERSSLSLRKKYSTINNISKTSSSFLKIQNSLNEYAPSMRRYNTFRNPSPPKNRLRKSSATDLEVNIYKNILIYFFLENSLAT